MRPGLDTLTAQFSEYESSVPVIITQRDSDEDDSTPTPTPNTGVDPIVTNPGEVEETVDEVMPSDE